MKLIVNVDGRSGELELSRTGDSCSFQYRTDRVDGEAYEASLVQVEEGIYSILLNGRSYEAKVVSGAEGFYVDLQGHRSVVAVRDPRSMSRQGKGGAGEGLRTVSAPMPGKVVRVLVGVGDEVEAGAGLVVVEAMKMQNELKAPKSGRVVQVKAELGATVGHGEMLVAIE